jgi:hypothetical protein
VQSASASTASGDASWTWTDGLVNLASNDAQRLTLGHASQTNFGHIFTFPAGPAEKLAKVAFHIYKGTLRCRAYLTDGSHAIVTDTSQSNASGDTAGFYDITYKSAQPEAKLVVILDNTVNNSGCIVGTQGALLAYT